MVVDEQQVFTCDTVTGLISGSLPTVGVKWSLRLNDAGTITARVRPMSAEAKAVNVRAATQPLYRSLGVRHGNTVLECGPILRRSFSASSGELTVTAAGLWSLFDRRKAINPAALAYSGDRVTGTEGDLDIGPTSLAGIARELVRRSVEDNPYGGGLNITYARGLDQGDEERTYKGYELRWIGDVLRKLTQEEGGPDIRFRPRLMGSDKLRVEWVLETGTPTQPLLQQAGNPWVWDGSLPDSGVVGFDTTEDATNMGALAWATGSGQERDMLLESWTETTNVELGAPWTEVDAASKQEEDRNVLRSQAQRGVREASGPLEDFSITVRADAAPTLGNYWPGDWAEVTIPEDHPMLAARNRRVRIMAMDGGDGANVKLTVAPLIGTTEGSGAGEGNVVVADPNAIVPAAYPSPFLFPSFNVYPT